MYQYVSREKELFAILGIEDLKFVKRRSTFSFVLRKDYKRQIYEERRYQFCPDLYIAVCENRNIFVDLHLLIMKIEYILSNAHTRINDHCIDYTIKFCYCNKNVH